MNKIALQQQLHSILEDMKASNIIDIDVHNFPTITDMMMICSGRSSRHVKAIANKVITQCKKTGIQPFSCSGEAGSEWIIVDLGNIVLHIMQPQVRQFYDLEGLWQQNNYENTQQNAS